MEKSAAALGRRLLSRPARRRNRSTVRARVTKSTPDYTLIRAFGAVDFRSYQPLYQVLTAQLASGRSRLVVDFDQVPLCDSSGLGMLVAVHRRATAAGGWLRLVKPRAELRRVLSVTNLDRLLGAYRSVDAATAAEA